jgi:hypothetical protein
MNTKAISIIVIIVVCLVLDVVILKKIYSNKYAEKFVRPKIVLLAIQTSNTGGSTYLIIKSAENYNNGSYETGDLKIQIEDSEDTVNIQVEGFTLVRRIKRDRLAALLNIPQAEFYIDVDLLKKNGPKQVNVTLDGKLNEFILRYDDEKNQIELLEKKVFNAFLEEDYLTPIDFIHR